MRNIYISCNFSHVTGAAEEDDKPVSTSTNIAYGMISKTVLTTTNAAYGIVPYDQQTSGKEDDHEYELVDQLPSSTIPTPASAATPSTTQQQCHEMEEPAYF